MVAPYFRLGIIIVFTNVLMLQQIDSRSTPPENDFVITVKTTQKFHDSRLKKIHNSWFRDAPENIFFITDSADHKWKRRLGNQIVPTDCSPNHFSRDLCCKMNAELHTFASKNARFYCHFDDDNVVLIQNLREFLSELDSNQLLYLGKVSIDRPIEYNKTPFRFATGGAGFCISSSLMRLILDYIDNYQRFESICEEIGLPDDVTLGYLIEGILQTPLYNVNAFHSHLPYDQFFNNDDQLISLGST